MRGLSFTSTLTRQSGCCVPFLHKGLCDAGAAYLLPGFVQLGRHTPTAEDMAEMQSPGLVWEPQTSGSNKCSFRRTELS